MGRPGAGAGGLAAGGGAHALGAASAGRRGKALGELERRSKREWSALYGRQERQREQLAKDCHGVLGRFRAWRELGGGVREIGGAIRGRTEVLGRFRAELEDRLRWERVSLGKRIPKRCVRSRARRENSTAVAWKGRRNGRGRRRGRTGSYWIL